ncbi:Fblim1 [Columba guinea]|nr:Fblim1 [Columba guinea]
MRPGNSSHRSGPPMASAMLPGKVEKRMASSVFITLVPPRREVVTKDKPHRELQPDGAEVPSSRHPRSPAPRPPALPNGETHPAAPTPVLVLSEAPQPLSAEALGPALQQLDLAEPSALQAPSAFPAKLRTPTFCQEQVSRSQWQDANGYTERDGSRDVCAFCHKALGLRDVTVEAMQKQYHADCFTCRTCHRLLAGQRYYQKDGRPTCDTCYQLTPLRFAAIRKYAVVCSACEQPIVPGEDKDTYKIECLGRSFHESCYRCESCGTPLSPEPTESGCYPLGDHLLCKSCHVRRRNESSC